jgi:hypothetical protein
VTARGRAIVAIVLAGLLAAPGPAHAYLKLGTSVDGSVLALTWPDRAPIRYHVSDRELADGVSAPDLRDAVVRAFDAWQDVETSTVAFEFGGFVGARPLDEDELNVLGFATRPELDRTLATTTFLIDTRDGHIVEADIFFNAAFDWSVAPQGEPGAYDLQSIATHEAGHLLGLGHSALGETEVAGSGRRLIASESVMFPIAFTAGSITDRQLTPDDIAGVSDVYPAPGFRRETGTIQGTVTKNGRGVVGAHVVAFNPRTGHLVGGFSLDDDGGFAIAGLDPGTYIIRVEPLDDGDLDSFFEDGAGVDTAFRAAFHPRLVSVSAGNGSARISIEVMPK